MSECKRTCERAVMQSADDSAAYLSIPCTCAAGDSRPAPEQDDDGREAIAEGDYRYYQPAKEPLDTLASLRGMLWEYEHALPGNSEIRPMREARVEALRAAIQAIRRELAPEGPQGWQPIATAPKGGGAELVTDPAWVKPPRILLLFMDTASVGYWDWYYAEGGNGYEGGLAWIEPVSGERLDLNFDAPTHWMPLPAPPYPEATPHPLACQACGHARISHRRGRCSECYCQRFEAEATPQEN